MRSRLFLSQTRWRPALLLVLWVLTGPGPAFAESEEEKKTREMCEGVARTVEPEKNKCSQDEPKAKNECRDRSSELNAIDAGATGDANIHQQRRNGFDRANRKLAILNPAITACDEAIEQCVAKKNKSCGTLNARFINGGIRPICPNKNYGKLGDTRSQVDEKKHSCDEQRDQLRKLKEERDKALRAAQENMEGANDTVNSDEQKLSETQHMQQAREHAEDEAAGRDNPGYDPTPDTTNVQVAPTPAPTTDVGGGGPPSSGPVGPSGSGPSGSSPSAQQQSPSNSSPNQGGSPNQSPQGQGQPQQAASPNQSPASEDLAKSAAAGEKLSPTEDGLATTGLGGGDKAMTPEEMAASPKYTETPGTMAQAAADEEKEKKSSAPLARAVAGLALKSSPFPASAGGGLTPGPSATVNAEEEADKADPKKRGLLSSLLGAAGGSAGGGGKRGGGSSWFSSSDEEGSSGGGFFNRLLGGNSKLSLGGLTVDLSSFLPGRRKMAGASLKEQGIHPSNVILWNAVQQRYRTLENTLDP